MYEEREREAKTNSVEIRARIYFNSIIRSVIVVGRYIDETSHITMQKTLEDYFASGAFACA